MRGRVARCGRAHGHGRRRRTGRRRARTVGAGALRTRARSKARVTRANRRTALSSVGRMRNRPPGASAPRSSRRSVPSPRDRPRLAGMGCRAALGRRAFRSDSPRHRRTGHGRGLVRRAGAPRMPQARIVRPRRNRRPPFRRPCGGRPAVPRIRAPPSSSVCVNHSRLLRSAYVLSLRIVSQQQNHHRNPTPSTSDVGRSPTRGTKASA